MPTRYNSLKEFGEYLRTIGVKPNNRPKARNGKSELYDAGTLPEVIVKPRDLGEEFRNSRIGRLYQNDKPLERVYPEFFLLNVLRNLPQISANTTAYNAAKNARFWFSKEMSREAAKRKYKQDIGQGLLNIVNPFFRNGGVVRPKARGGKGVKTNSTTTTKPRFTKNLDTPVLNWYWPYKFNLSQKASAAIMEANRGLRNAVTTLFNPIRPVYSSDRSEKVSKSFIKDMFIPNDKGKTYFDTVSKKKSYDDTRLGMPQNTFLMSSDKQRKAMENKGYVYVGDKDEDYNRTFVAAQAKKLGKDIGYKLPVYLTQPNNLYGHTWSLIPKNYKGKSFRQGYSDEINSDLVNRHAALTHAGHFPYHYETDETGKVYIQADDVNDYDGSILGVNLGRLLTHVGSPTVITTGPRYLNEWGIDNALDENSILRKYLSDPNHNLRLVSKRGEYPKVGYVLNDIVVTPKGNYTLPKSWTLYNQDK